MKKLVRSALNQLGLDISRSYNGAPRWSGIASEYYPVEFRPRWGHGLPSHPQISELLSAKLPSFVALLNDFVQYKKYFDGIPEKQTSPKDPYWDNAYFSALDGAALMYFILSSSPKRY